MKNDGIIYGPKAHLAFDFSVSRSLMTKFKRGINELQFFMCTAVRKGAAEEMTEKPHIAPPIQFKKSLCN